MSAEIATALRLVLADDKTLWEVARRAVEDHLIEMRDSGIFIAGPGNGFTVNYPDGTPGPLRMSTFHGLKVALEALAEHHEAAPVTPSGDTP